MSTIITPENFSIGTATKFSADTPATVEATSNPVVDAYFAGLGLEPNGPVDTDLARFAEAKSAFAPVPTSTKDLISSASRKSPTIKDIPEAGVVEKMGDFLKVVVPAAVGTVTAGALLTMAPAGVGVVAAGMAGAGLGFLLGSVAAQSEIPGSEIAGDLTLGGTVLGSTVGIGIQQLLAMGTAPTLGTFVGVGLAAGAGIAAGLIAKKLAGRLGKLV